ncbi:hypothetical protein GKZ68_10430 [Hymenobacter sp. BRD128]|uniref:hypothetical protein n=1 Tax=Hymenobacter sp. BRD128 TaxID=2675878 RepID=UPI001565968A|nr:hypothetical protein [Hymenobacter sp. BRD128]QKG57006.1 hypothetical protein GKZ68_10430 [Hymenobacter sp. BRD128]
MQVDQAQLDAWKAQYGDIFQISVALNDSDTATAYLKPADRNVMAVALMRVAKDQMLEPGEFILTNCFIGGDERLKLTTGLAQTPAQISAALAAVALVKTLEATVKNA